MYRIGKIVNTHGINGEVKILQVTDFTDLFAVNKTVYLKLNDQLRELKIEKSRLHKQTYILKFKEFDSINEVESLKGAQLFVKEDQLPKLEEKQFHYHEIIGCSMYTTNDDYVGKVIDILAPGANDVWVVKNETGKEHLIPYIDDVVKSVDIKEEKIMIELMEGLLD